MFLNPFTQGLQLPNKTVQGVYAAILTPRGRDGALDELALARLIRYLLEQNIRGFAINGATGEFCLTTPDELRRILEVASAELGPEAEFVCGIGSAGIAASIQLGEIAAEGGAKAVLLPMPYFFPYEQSDLDAFSREVAAALPIPALLYNLPQFTSGLEPDTSLRLISECPNIIGIKDSSGSLDTLRALTQAKVECCRLVGNDSAIAGALEERLCDGVISGIACVLPELIASIYSLGSARSQDMSSREDLAQRVQALDQFVDRISVLPVPWGLKWVAESLGMAPAHFAQTDNSPA